MDLLAALRGTTPLENSLLLFVFPLSSSPFSVIVGRRADRTGSPGKLMAVGIACVGAGLFGFYLTVAYASRASLFPLALLCALAMGFGSSFYHPLGASVLQGTFGKGTIGRALGLNGSMGSVGRALYPSLFFAAAALFTRPGSMGFFGLVAFGAALLIWRGLGRIVFRKPHGEAKPPTIRSTLNRSMAILLVVTFARSAAIGGIAYYIPIFLTTQRGLGIGSLLGVALTATYASGIVGQPIFGSLTDRFDHRVVLVVSAVGASAAIVGCVNTSGALSVALLALFGFFTFTGFPLLMALASDYSEHRASALGNSVIWGLGDSTGTSLGPLLVYAMTLDSYVGLGLGFEVMAVLMVVSSAAALILPRAISRV